MGEAGQGGLRGPRQWQSTPPAMWQDLGLGPGAYQGMLSRPLPGAFGSCWPSSAQALAGERKPSHVVKPLQRMVQVPADEGGGEHAPPGGKAGALPQVRPGAYLSSEPGTRLDPFFGHLSSPSPSPIVLAVPSQPLEAAGEVIGGPLLHRGLGCHSPGQPWTPAPTVRSEQLTGCRPLCPWILRE